MSDLSQDIIKISVSNCHLLKTHVHSKAKMNFLTGKEQNFHHFFLYIYQFFFEKAKTKKCATLLAQPKFFQENFQIQVKFAILRHRIRPDDSYRMPTFLGNSFQIFPTASWIFRGVRAAQHVLFLLVISLGAVRDGVRTFNPGTFHPMDVSPHRHFTPRTFHPDLKSSFNGRLY